MSFNIKVLKDLVVEGASKVQGETFKGEDFSKMMDFINYNFTVKEFLDSGSPQLATLWNQIIIDVIGSLHSASSGFYRQAASSLRDVLELSCNTIYFYDHNIELYLYLTKDEKADKYVSTLIDQYKFFTSDYIKSFYGDIGKLEIGTNKYSNELRTVYRRLCDIVHCRYKTLSGTSGKVEYDKREFAQYRNDFLKVASLIKIMSGLRFELCEKGEIQMIGREIGVFK